MKDARAMGNGLMAAGLELLQNASRGKASHVPLPEQSVRAIGFNGVSASARGAWPGSYEAQSFR